jgi:hypothetical protein
MFLQHDTVSNCHPERIRSDNGATKKSKDPEDVTTLMAAAMLFHDAAGVSRWMREASNDRQ